MITGSLVAIVTPMHEDGSVDLDSLAGLIEHHIEAGTDGVISVGTTGESATLSHDEHRVVIEKTIQCVNGRIPVIAGTGSNSTTEALELTKIAHELGCRRLLIGCSLLQQAASGRSVPAFQTDRGICSHPADTL